MPQSWDMGRIFSLPPSEGRHAGDYSDTRKIQRLRPGSNPRTRVPEAGMLTTRPPKPLLIHVINIRLEGLRKVMANFTEVKWRICPCPPYEAYRCTGDGRGHFRGSNRLHFRYMAKSKCKVYMFLDDFAKLRRAGY